MKNSGYSRKVYFITVLCDMFKLFGIWFWILAFFSFLAVIFVVQRFDIIIDPEKLPKILLNIIPQIMGFLIAGLAIIMGFNDVTLKRLSARADDGKVPVLVIIASFSVCLLVLLMTLTISTIYVNITFNCEGCYRLLGAFVIFGAVISVESVIHVIFHLFATGTYLINGNKD